MPPSIDCVAGAPGASALFALVETIESLSLARSVEAVAAVIRSAARRISDADGACFVLKDGDRCWYLDEDAIGPLWKGQRFPLTACISGWAMLNRKTAVIPDIYADERIPHDAYRPTFVKSLVMTPVRPSDPLAAIGAYWAERRSPTEAEVMKLEAMARATAVALENANLYASLREALERRKLLIRELDHRCKNTLAAVQSIVDQTLRRSASPAKFAEGFEARLSALARAHEQLARDDWGRAPLMEIIRLALAPYGEVGGRRIRAEGPDLTLSPECALTMHAALNELALNAAGHGALGPAGGEVAISWSVDMSRERRQVEFQWLERDGPPVEPPKSDGFGRRLIERGLARDMGGEARLRFDPAGVRFQLTAPLSHRIALA
jgi:two-component sensor histidine kinase